VISGAYPEVVASNFANVALRCISREYPNKPDHVVNIGIASALPLNDPARNRLIKSAETHAKDGLDHVASGNYEGEHWLASLAVYLSSLAVREVK
jgi:hypothetical protein